MARAASFKRPIQPLEPMRACSSGRVSRCQYVPCACSPLATAASARPLPQYVACSRASHRTKASESPRWLERPSRRVMQMVTFSPSLYTANGVGTIAPAAMSFSAWPLL
jgi:hypothetical protein